jgi:hypothetical protein
LFYFNCRLLTGSFVPSILLFFVSIFNELLCVAIGCQRSKLISLPVVGTSRKRGILISWSGWNVDIGTVKNHDLKKRNQIIFLLLARRPDRYKERNILSSKEPSCFDTRQSNTRPNHADTQAYRYAKHHVQQRAHEKQIYSQ